MPPVNTFDLASKLPRRVFRLDTSGDLEKFIGEVLQPVLDLAIEEDLERFPRQNDPDLADENAVDAMLRDLGNPFEVAFELPLTRRRLLVRLMVEIHKNKGTALAIRLALRALLGIEIIQVVFPIVGDKSWILGRDVIGDTAADPPPANPALTDFAFLGASPTFQFYSFQVLVPVPLAAEQELVGTKVVDLVKPAHTHFLGFVTPGAGQVFDHWVLDVSRLHDTGEPVQDDEAVLHGP